MMISIALCGMACLLLGCQSAESTPPLIRQQWAIIADGRSNEHQLSKAYAALSTIPVRERAQVWIPIADNQRLPAAQRSTAQTLFFDRFVVAPVPLSTILNRYPIRSWFTAGGLVDSTMDENTPFDSDAARTPGGIFFLKIPSDHSEDVPTVPWLRILPLASSQQIVRAINDDNKDNYVIQEVGVPSPSRSDLRRKER
jgi:hypothetical protein